VQVIEAPAQDSRTNSYTPAQQTQVSSDFSEFSFGEVCSTLAGACVDLLSITTSALPPLSDVFTEVGMQVVQDVTVDTLGNLMREEPEDATATPTEPQAVAITVGIGSYLHINGAEAAMQAGNKLSSMIPIMALGPWQTGLPDLAMASFGGSGQGADASAAPVAYAAPAAPVNATIL
jgi:hypothetical protein